MPIDLTNAVSNKTRERLDSKDNKPSAEPGFESGIDFSNLFDDLDDIDSGSSGFGDGFGSSDGFSGGNSGFGESSGFGDSFGSGGNNGFGNGNGFGDASGFGGGTGFGGLNIGGQLGQNVPTATKEPPKKDVFDTAMEFTGDALKASGSMLKALVIGLKTKNFNDFVSVMIDWLTIGGASILIGMILKVAKVFSDIASLGTFGSNLLIAGALTAGFGAVGFGISSLGVLSDKDTDKHISDMADIKTEMDGLTFDDGSLEDVYASMLDDFALDNLDNESIESSESSSGSSSFWDSSDSNDSFSSFDNTEEDDTSGYENNDERVKAIAGNNPKIDRKFLVETLGPFFPENASGFSDIVKLEPGSDEYDTIRALTLQAVSDAAKVDMEELSCDIVSVESSLFCYVIVCERQKGLSKLDELKREIESNFRSDAEDVSVNASISIEHGNYKIVLTKGAADIVTIGDCLQLPEVKNFFLDGKNDLPFIAGIDQYGKPILADGKHYTTMMIAGKPRSGKSWMVNGILLPLMTFNTPEDIITILIDPKKSNLFKTIACMPHVIGLHDGTNILQIMQEVIEIEGERRKELLNKYRCDNIWDLRKRKNIKLPVLLIVIDEYMTMMGNLSQSGLDKEFVELFNMAITQLPFVGIHFMFVPHRAQGVVSKITRSMIMFTAAVRADDEIVKETLDVKKWDRPLTKPGDTALKMADTGLTKYVRGAAITTSDTDNMSLIEDLCRAWYKMGVDIPNKNGLKICFNRDEVEIADMLGINASDVTHMQYSDDEMYGNNKKTGVNEGVVGGGFKFDDDDFDFNNEKADNIVDSSVLRGNIGISEEEDAIDEEWLNSINDIEEQDSNSSSNKDDGWQSSVTASNLWDDED